MICKKAQSNNEINLNKIVKRAVNLTFQSSLNHEAINKIEMKFSSIIKKNSWYFVFGEYKKNQVEKIFQTAKIILIQQLTLHFCKNSNIIKQISGISFPRLKRLNLCGNKIKSLEQLTKTNLQNLQYLLLRDNLITNLKSFRKFNFRLIFLQLSDNYITQFNDCWISLDISRLQVVQAGNNNWTFNYSFFKNIANLQRFRVRGNPNINKQVYYRIITTNGVKVFSI